jgi:hypothetical protein
MMIHDPIAHMNQLMTGMFWGGLVMALPPVILGIWIGAVVFRRYRADKLAARLAANIGTASDRMQ